jgi:hypothetical protein
MENNREAFKKMMENFSMEDFAVIKLMEEITELDQEMKLKKSQIENRMQLLNRLL